jgi:hypothetical protein
MPVFTSGKVSVLPIGVSTTLTVAQVRDLLKARKPNHTALTGGWASIGNSNSNLRVYDAAPPVSDPVLVPATPSTPEHLYARYYFFVKDTKAEQANPSATPQSYHQLDAIDVIVSKTGANTLLAVFSTRNTTELNIGARKVRQNVPTNVGALTSFETLLKGGDSKAIISTTSSPLNLGDPDFFLWLMEQWRDKRDLTADVTLTAVNGLNGKDNASRVTQLQQQVDFFRVGLLTSIAEKDTLGPVKLAFKDTAANAKLDIELFVDGGFAVHVVRTHYRGIVDQAELRLRAVEDLVFTYIPILRDLYQADGLWVTTRRDKLITEAFNSLANRYRIGHGAAQVGQPCPHCGQVVPAA